MKRLTSFFAISIILCFISAGQEKISYNGSGNYTLRERTDLRRYDNGKYIGLVSREVTSFINPVSCEDGYEYEGNFYVNQKTNHNLYRVGNTISDYIYASFKIDDKGNLKMFVDNGFPTFRSFPAFPDKKITKGDSWTAKAERIVDPLNKGIATKMPIYVQYRYIGDDVFYDEPVFLLSAQWATRYGMGSGTSYIDWGGDKELQKAAGSHNATIYVSKKTGNSIVIRDNVDETFYYDDGNVIQFKGTISLFTEYPPAVDTSELIPVLKRICELSDEQTDTLFASSSPLQETKPLSGITDNGTSDTSRTNSTNSTNGINGINGINGNDDIQKIISKNVTKEEHKNSINIDVEKTPAGIKLSIQNLQFKPDSSELLDSEKNRLSQIAEILNTVPQTKLLVEGHTAKTGNDKGEMQLSIERAFAISNALTNLGVDSNRFICRGYGSTKPVVDNSTPQGKARNRRVEITILQ